MGKGRALDARRVSAHGLTDHGSEACDSRTHRRAPAGLPLRLRTALDVNVGSALVPPITALVEVAQLVGAWVPLVLFPHGLEPAKYGSLET